MPLDQLRSDSKLRPNRRRQTGGPWQVVSLDAVFDPDLEVFTHVLFVAHDGFPSGGSALRWFRPFPPPWEGWIEARKIKARSTPWGGSLTVSALARSYSARKATMGSTRAAFRAGA